MTASHLIETSIEQVTVFYRAALVTREGTIPDISGEKAVELRIKGLPLALSNSSIRAGVMDSSGWKEDDGREEQVSKRIRFTHRSGWTVRNVTVEVDCVDEQEKETVDSSIDILEKELREKNAALQTLRAQLEEITKLILAPLPPKPEQPEEGEAKLFPFQAWEAFIRTCEKKLETFHGQERELVQAICAQEKELKTRRDLQERSRMQASQAPASGYCKNLIITLIHRREASHPPEKLQVSYIVPGAQWKPVYKLYIQKDYKKATLVMGARVAQHSGEDWPQVRLSFSAARLERLIQLPELPSRRIGRAQKLKQISYRTKEPPPADLFSAFDLWVRSQKTISRPAMSPLNLFFDQCEKKLGQILGAVPGGMPAPATPTTTPGRLPSPSAPPPPPPQVVPAPCAPADYFRQAEVPEAQAPLQDSIMMPCVETGVFASADDTSMMKPDPRAVLPPITVSKDKAAPVAARVGGFVQHAAQIAAPFMKTSRAFTGKMEEQEEVMSKRRSAQPSPAAPEPEAVWLSESTGEQEAPPLNYFDYELQGVEPEKAEFRGKLRQVRCLTFSERVRENESHVLGKIHDAVRATEISLIQESELPSFQCVYEAACRAHIPGDGHPHSVDIMDSTAESQIHFRTVPMTDPKVFRRLTLKNPFSLPLPEGQVQVFLDNAYMFSTPLRGVGREGQVLFSLGMEPGLRVSRNTSFSQDEKGIVAENSIAAHGVTINIRSHLPGPSTVEVIERIPIKEENEKKIDIKILSSEPRGEQVEFIDDVRIRGAQRWIATVQPGEEVSFKLDYRIFLPSKMELQGGNRRV